MKLASGKFVSVIALLSVAGFTHAQESALLPGETTRTLLEQTEPVHEPTLPHDIILSLEAAINVALDNNPAIRQARSNLEAAEANFDLSRSPYRTLINLNSVASARFTRVHELAGTTILNPTRSAQEGRPIYDYVGGRHTARTEDHEEIGLSQVFSKTFRNGTRLQFQTDETVVQDSLRFYDDDPDKSSDLQGSAQVTYTIPFNSRARLSISTDLENAELAYQQSLNTFYVQREQLIYQVNVAYWNLQLSEARLDIQRDDLAQKRWTYEYYRIQNEYGFVPDLLVKQSRVVMNEAEASLLELESRVQSDYENFNLLLGLPLDYRVELTDPLTVPELERTPEEYVDRVLQTNLQLKNLRLALDQMENNLAVTRLGQQPDVQLVSSYQHDDGGDSFANLQFLVSWPFGDGGATKARVRASQSNIDEQLVEIWDTERALKQRVLRIMRDIETARRQLKINEERVKLAAEALDTANFQFENGQIDFRDLQDAQADLANSRLVLEMTKYELVVSAAELESLIHEY